MMGGGTLLRHSALVDSAAGRGALPSLVYIAVGTALLIADRVLWAAAVAPAGRQRARAGCCPTSSLPRPAWSEPA